MENIRPILKKLLKRTLPKLGKKRPQTAAKSTGTPVCDGPVPLGKRIRPTPRTPTTRPSARNIWAPTIPDQGLGPRFSFELITPEPYPDSHPDSHQKRKNAVDRSANITPAGITPFRSVAAHILPGATPPRGLLKFIPTDAQVLTGAPAGSGVLPPHDSTYRQEIFDAVGRMAEPHPHSSRYIGPSAVLSSRTTGDNQPTLSNATYSPLNLCSALNEAVETKPQPHPRNFQLHDGHRNAPAAHSHGPKDPQPDLSSQISSHGRHATPPIVYHTTLREIESILLARAKVCVPHASTNRAAILSKDHPAATPNSSTATCTSLAHQGVVTLPQDYREMRCALNSGSRAAASRPGNAAQISHLRVHFHQAVNARQRLSRRGTRAHILGQENANRRKRKAMKRAAAASAAGNGNPPRVGRGQGRRRRKTTDLPTRSGFVASFWRCKFLANSQDPSPQESRLARRAT